MDTQQFNYRIKTNLAVACAGLLLLIPLLFCELLRGHALRGFACGLLIGLLAYNSCVIKQKGKVPWTTPFLFAPTVVAFLILSVLQQGVNGALWSFPAVIGLYFMLGESQARIVNIMVLAAVIPVAWTTLPTSLALGVTVSLGTVSGFSALSLHLINIQQRTLREMAILDPLTGVYNRNLLELSLQRAAQQGRRSQVEMSLAVMDLDHFKSINDTHGHDVGDKVLREVGCLLSTRLRGSDQIFRIGGEEFLVLFYQTDEQAALQVAEELRQTLAAQEIVEERPVTASIGLACLKPTENWQEWLKRADLCLYQAKSAGRNRVVSELHCSV